MLRGEKEQFAIKERQKHSRLYCCSCTLSYTSCTLLFEAILLTIHMLAQAGCRGHLVSFDQRNEKLIRRRNPCVCVLFLPWFIFQLRCAGCNIQKFNFLLLNK
jgi:hypothetical protein